MVCHRLGRSDRSGQVDLSDLFVVRTEQRLRSGSLPSPGEWPEPGPLHVAVYDAEASLNPCEPPEVWTGLVEDCVDQPPEIDAAQSRSGEWLYRCPAQPPHANSDALDPYPDETKAKLDLPRTEDGSGKGRDRPFFPSDHPPIGECSATRPTRHASPLGLETLDRC